MSPENELERAEKHVNRPSHVRAMVAATDRMRSGSVRCKCGLRASVLTDVGDDITPLCADCAQNLALDNRIAAMKEQRAAMRRRS